ncbi:MAG: ferredoxin--NADP(+) reductase [Rhodospirillales bacterium RIFCSPLOWO2_12_FULL_58_28]|nr:MAG: ferredoxin--NADP(+) reductase [Rhodospirillales bacterium RIFCSPLOWO2_02_FULL_58_16]OHC78226.1 MAG: ferredoxin--NADP(+) reductase [Rhodospirillales bacterium RIFCSPLOWO2_12_FULL_58_28]
MTNTSHRTDVAVIGAGPAGLFSIFQCGMMKMRCHVIDVLDATGGQCRALYPEKPIYDIPGHPKILAGDLVQKLEQQAAPFAPVFHLGQQVVKLEPADDARWRLETSTGVAINAKAVFIAAGVGAFGPNRPPLEGIEAFEGKSVHYMVKRREDFKGKRVVIAGGGDSAVDWALSLADIAAGVSIIHRRVKFRAAPGSADKLKELIDKGVIELVAPYQLAALEGSNGQIETVVARSLDGDERRLGADALLSFFGLSQTLGPIAEWGLNLDHNYIKVDPADYSAGKPGLFAIGDIASYPGKLKLILCGFAEAAVAAHAAYPLVHPDEALHFEYSTTGGAPGGK